MIMNIKVLKNKNNLIGSWIQIGSPDIILMMIEAGFDFLVLDMEHGSISDSDLPRIFQLFKGSECIPMVRVANNDSILIRRALDQGARGIIVPGVKSKEEVEKAKKAIFYPPKGERGIGYSRVNNYGLEFDKYFKEANQNIIFIIQIEHKVAISQIDKIFSVKNIDSYMIGPYDLTGSMGIIGEFENPIYQNSLDIIKKSAAKNNIKSGIHVVNPKVNDLKSAIKENYSLIAYSTDALLLYDKCNKELKEVNELRSI
jgi:2-dehydro-3-deoxyglucarate aldolase